MIDDDASYSQGKIRTTRRRQSTSIRTEYAQFVSASPQQVSWILNLASDVISSLAEVLYELKEEASMHGHHTTVNHTWT